MSDTLEDTGVHILKQHPTPLFPIKGTNLKLPNCKPKSDRDFIKVIQVLLTAGRAKKDIANTEKQEAIVFPIHVWGTLSP